MAHTCPKNTYNNSYNNYKENTAQVKVRPRNGADKCMQKRQTLFEAEKNTPSSSLVTNLLYKTLWKTSSTRLHLALSSLKSQLEGRTFCNMVKKVDIYIEIIYSGL